MGLTKLVQPRASFFSLKPCPDAQQCGEDAVTTVLYLDFFLNFLDADPVQPRRVSPFDMIGNSPVEYVFIRIAIFCLHYFPLLVIAGLVVLLVVDHDAHSLILGFQAIAIAEAIFYVLIFLPRYHLCQRKARFPPLESREERKRLFQKGLEHVSDPEQYISKWFLNAPLTSIRRDNVKDFYCWALFNKIAWDPEEDEELEEYANKLEQLLGSRLQAGRGPAEPLRLTLEPVNILYRPLLWYMIIATVDLYVYGYLILAGFRHYRLRLSSLFSQIPLRLISLTALKVSPAPSMSYWVRPHTSRTRKPIVFIHGVGIGLWPYITFLKEINKSYWTDDGQIGIIAIELMPICARISPECPDQPTICRDIMSIVRQHQAWDEFVLVSQSYGTVIAANMMKNEEIARHISSVVLIDPINFLLHLPDIAYNFTRRQPRKANEHQLWYFACTDIMIAHTIARHFFWTENILWKEDIRRWNATVVLGGRDLIVPVNAVGRYLMEDEPAYERFLNEGETGIEASDSWKERQWRGEGLDVLWLDRCDHVQSFEKRRDYGRIIDIIRSYSADAE